MTTKRNYNHVTFRGETEEIRSQALLVWLQTMDPDNFFIVSINEIVTPTDKYVSAWYYTLEN